eukprot:CAMPEP_0197884460 /NCGR_PEP_ID=MMETSP1439-20131203/10903_1 /TAXON_ID=66791 /ORGANISM="Gonyaulax spinifera, Strain CCMP409" /LENGTH=56 /DNA_ID=CAMNT_0043504193 /DNA_START=300 /DNA_END=467 /DNA_ORIENTATION=-
MAFNGGSSDPFTPGSLVMGMLAQAPRTQHALGSPAGGEAPRRWRARCSPPAPPPRD